MAPQIEHRHPILKSIDASNSVGLCNGRASVSSDRRAQRDSRFGCSCDIFDSGSTAVEGNRPLRAVFDTHAA
jgi:hypothetical protein